MKKILMIIVLSFSYSLLLNCAAGRPAKFAEEAAAEPLAYDQWRKTVHLQELKQVTSHAAMDYNVSISQNGDEVFFISDRGSGDLNVWKKSFLGGGFENLTEQYPGSDFGICKSLRKKNTLVFVSSRSDPQGDIWLLKKQVNRDLFKIWKMAGIRSLTSWQSIQLTQIQGYEGEPDISPDGNKIIFTRKTGDEYNIWLINKGMLGWGRSRQITSHGGRYAKFSPDGNRIVYCCVDSSGNGDLYMLDIITGEETRLTKTPGCETFPCFSPKGNRIAYTMYRSDDNGDGSINPDDNGTIWIMDVRYRIPTQITDGEFSDSRPVWSANDNRIYFTSLRSGNSDIWSIYAEADGTVPIAPNSEFQLKYAQEQCMHQSIPIERRVLNFMRLLDYFPDDISRCTRALLTAADLYINNGREKEARNLYSRILNEYKIDVEACGKAEIMLIVLGDNDRFDLAAKDSVVFGKNTYSERADSSINELVKLQERYASSDNIKAEAIIRGGDIYRRRGNSAAAFDHYSEVQNKYSSQKTLAARAQNRIAGTYVHFKLGSIKDFIKSYFITLQNYGDQKSEGELAFEEVLNLIKSQDDFNSRIAAFNYIFDNYKNYSWLCAAAYYHQGRMYFENRKYESALAAFRKIEELYPDQPKWLGRAKIGIGDCFIAQGDYIKGANYYESTFLTGPSEAGYDLYNDARNKFFETLIERGEYYYYQREASSAIKMFRRVLGHDPVNIRGLRGLVKTMAAMGRLKEIIKTLQKELKGFGDNQALHYALAYAYTFKFDENRNSRW
ncbi:MAG: tetratricopeptide repeat protein, partial [bacterium]